VQTTCQNVTHKQTNTQFLQAGCPSCCPTNRVRALKGDYATVTIQQQILQNDNVNDTSSIKTDNSDNKSVRKQKFSISKLLPYIHRYWVDNTAND